MQNKISTYAILIFFLVACFLKIYRHTFFSTDNYGVIDWDNFGYYLYLPSLFIYDDIKLQNDDRIEEIIEKYNLSSSYYQAHPLENGNRVIQYSSGLSLIYSPAFFIGHTWAKLSEKYAADGFSHPYQIAILVESFLLLFIGLYYLRKLCLEFFSDIISALVILTICFGTNYFAIASINISSPHNILFAAYSMILYYTHQWHQNPSGKKLLLLSAVMATLILSRPNELLFLMVPLFWVGGVFTSFKAKIVYFLKKPAQLILVATPFILIGLIQPIYWHHVTGEWIYDSYINEDFKLADPYLREYLFSFKKGWLLYTPIMVFAFIGFIPFAKKKKSLAFLFLLFTLLNIWILSSWDCWWYAASFSQRSIVQSYPLFVLPIGYLLTYLQHANKSLKYGLSSLILFFFVLNLFQTYQYRKGVIDSSRMTKEYYVASFFDLSPNVEKQKLLEPKRDIKQLPEGQNFKYSIIYNKGFASFHRIQDSVHGFSFEGEGSHLLTKELPYSHACSFPFSDYCDTSFAYFKATIRYRSNYSASENQFGIVAQTRDSRSGKIYKYDYKSVLEVDNFKVGEWCNMDMFFVPPYLRSSKDSLFFFLHLSGSQPVEIDQFYVEMFEPSDQPKSNQNVFFTDYHSLKSEQWGIPGKVAGNKSYEYIDSVQMYSSTLKVSGNELNSHQIVFNVSGFSLNKSLDETYAVVSIKDIENQQFYYDSELLNPATEWDLQSFSFNLPTKFSHSDTLYCYLWGKSSPYLIRSLSIQSN